MRAAVVVMLLAAPDASATIEHSFVGLGYRAVIARHSVTSADFEGSIRSASHLAPNLELAVYGGDWFFRFELGASVFEHAHVGIVQPTGGLTLGSGVLFAHHEPSALSTGEAGVLLRAGAGRFGVGLRAEGVVLGVAGRDREGTWIAGGRGADLGVILRYPFDPLGSFRIEPSAIFGGTILDGKGSPALRGVFGTLGIELRVAVAGPVSFRGAAAIDLRRTADEAALSVLEGVAIRLDAGIALSGLFDDR